MWIGRQKLINVGQKKEGLIFKIKPSFWDELKKQFKIIIKLFSKQLFMMTMMVSTTAMITTVAMMFAMFMVMITHGIWIML